MEIGFIGPRHPQSTIIKNGRPKTTGPFKTRDRLVEAVLERSGEGKSAQHIARILGVSQPTITKIIKEKK